MNFLVKKTKNKIRQKKKNGEPVRIRSAKANANDVANADPRCNTAAGFLHFIIKL